MDSDRKCKWEHITPITPSLRPDSYRDSPVKTNMIRRKESLQYEISGLIIKRIDYFSIRLEHLTKMQVSTTYYF